MIEQVIEQRRRNLRGGLEVGRVLPSAQRRMVGPYVFFDHMGPLDIAPCVDCSVDVRPHPHVGLSTVTYLFAGEVMHRDSLGYVQAIRPREVNWMTAGRGITHSERFARARARAQARAKGDHLHGIQAWVALPTEYEEVEPSFSHHVGDDLPQWHEGGVTGQLIAGSAYGLTAATATHSPQFYAHLDGATYGAGRMLVLRADASSVRAVERSALMVLGGDPLGERFVYWNFVSSSKQRLAQAAAAWKAGRMKLPDADNADFIPLPNDSSPLAPATT